MLLVDMLCLTHKISDRLPVTTMLTLNTPPLANLQRYDALRNAQPHEASPESDHA